MKLFASLVVLCILLHTSHASACMAMPYATVTKKDLESLKDAQPSETAFIGVVVFYVDERSKKNTPFTIAKPVFKVLKGFGNAREGELKEGLSGITCGDPPLPRLEDFFLYSDKTKPHQVFFDLRDKEVASYLKKNLNLDLFASDKSFSVFSRIKFELARKKEFIMLATAGIIFALIYWRNRRRQKTN